MQGLSNQNTISDIGGGSGDLQLPQQQGPFANVSPMHFFMVFLAMLWAWMYIFSKQNKVGELFQVVLRTWSCFAIISKERQGTRFSWGTGAIIGWGREDGEDDSISPSKGSYCCYWWTRSCNRKNFVPRSTRNPEITAVREEVTAMALRPAAVVMVLGWRTSPYGVADGSMVRAKSGG